MNADRAHAAGPVDVAFESQLLAEFHATRDPQLRDELVRRHLPLARRLAGRYSYSDEPFDDLVQVASIGLIKAIDRFDPSHGAKLSSFAVPTILGELKRYFRDKTWALHVPRGLQDLSLKITRETERMAKTLGRSPTAAELSRSTGLRSSRSSTDRTPATPTARRPSTSPSRPTATAPADRAARPRRPPVRTRRRPARDGRRLGRAAPAQRDVLRLRFIEDLTQREIGDRIGYSQMHVSRLLRQALATLADS